LNHASLVDGCRLSRARIEIYPHADADAARRLLEAGAASRRRLLVTESLFSMDGDAAPLPALADAAAATDSVLVVDEAHAIAALAALADRRSIPGAPPGPILPILIGSEARALAVADRLRARGLFVPAIRPPTVPAGSSRLRVTLSAAHEPGDIGELAAALSEI